MPQPRPAQQQKRDAKQPAPAHFHSYDPRAPQHPAHLINQRLRAANLRCSAVCDHLSTCHVTHHFTTGVPGDGSLSLGWTTRFTARPGTTMIFTTFFPAMRALTFSSASAAASITFASEPAGTR